MKYSKKEKWIIGKTGDIVVKKLKFLYLVQLIYILAVCMILEPFYSFVITKLLRGKGYSYLTPEMMGKFFTDPVVILVMVLLLLLLCIVIVLLYVFMYQYANEIYQSGNRKGIAALRRATACCLRGVRECPVSFLLLLMGGVLFHNIPVLVLACRSISSVRYVVEGFFSLKHTREIVIGMTILLLLYFFRNYFTLPYMFFENISLREARKKSRGLWQQKHWRAIGGWLFWNFCMTLFTILFYLTVSSVSVVIIMLFISNELKMAVFFTIRDHLYLITLLASLILGTTVQVVGNTVLFYYYKKEVKEEIVDTEKIPEKQDGLFRQRFVAVVFVVILCLDIVATHDRIRNGGNATFEHLGQITISSHRGASSEAPENTLPAIEKALDTTADYIEIDVQETKDGEVVLMHDSSAYRTTGMRAKISELTYEQISKLDAGSWFSAKYKNTPVPTLREVLELCKGKIKLNIEIKSDKSMPELEKKVVDLIEEFDLIRQCVVTSVYKESLTKIKKYNKDIMTGYILSSAYGRYYLDKEIDFLSMRSSFVNERVIRLAHKNGKEVCVWTVNSKKEAIRMSRLGVDNIITDRPSFIRQVLYEEGENQSLITLLKMIL